MKILQIVPELNQGGVETGVVELNRELVKRNHQSFVISAGGKLSEQIKSDGGTHIKLDVCSKNILTAHLRSAKLKKIIKNISPDIVHPRSRVPAWLSVFALKNLNIPLITTVHGFNSVNFYSKVMTRGQRVIYASSAVKDYIIKNYKIDPSKLRYVPRGIDTNYFDPEKTDNQFIENFINKYNLNNRCVISIIARITELKGHDIFIKAIANIYQKNKKIIGLIIGRTAPNKENYMNQLQNLITQLKCRDAFCFVGPQSNLREIYSISNFVVSAASKKPETFGRIAAESLAMNTPVIASAHGGSLDIINDRQNGLFFEPGSEQDLSEKLQNAMQTKFTNMRPHIENNFSLDIMVEKELQVYAELIK